MEKLLRPGNADNAEWLIGIFSHHLFVLMGFFFHNHLQPHQSQKNNHQQLFKNLTQMLHNRQLWRAEERLRSSFQRMLRPADLRKVETESQRSGVFRKRWKVSTHAFMTRRGRFTHKTVTGMEKSLIFNLRSDCRYFQRRQTEALEGWFSKSYLCFSAQQLPPFIFLICCTLKASTAESSAGRLCRKTPPVPRGPAWLCYWTIQ